MLNVVLEACWISGCVTRIVAFGVFQVQDVIPASIGFCTEEGPISTSSSNAVFRRGQPLPSVKIITLHRSSGFTLDAFYVDENELPPGTSTQIGSFQVC
jgi:heat shock protein 4